MDPDLLYSSTWTILSLFHNRGSVFLTVARGNLNLQRGAENKRENSGFPAGSYLPAECSPNKPTSGRHLRPLQALRESAALPVVTVNLCSSKNAFNTFRTVTRYR